MPNSLRDRLAPAAGVVGGALIFAGLLTPGDVADAAGPADSAETIAAAFADQQDEARLGVSLALVGTFLLVWFLGWLRHRLRPPFGAVAFGGGLLALAALAPYLAILIAESNDSIAVSGEAARALLLLDWEYAGVSAPGWAALVGATSLAIIRDRLLPIWLAWGAWLGLLLAIGLAFSGFFGGFLVMLGLLWLIGAATAFVIRPGERTQPS